MEDFVKELRKRKIGSIEKLPVINNWQSLLNKALSCDNYEIFNGSETLHEYSGRKYDYYQVLSAYLLSIKKALKNQAFRIDESNRVQIDFNNGFIATLSMKEMPIKTPYNEALLGDFIKTHPISLSGYDNKLYTISFLELFFEGHHFKFEFQAYAILNHGFNSDQNASGKVLDDENEEYY